MYNVTTIGHGLGRSSQTAILVWGLGGYGEARVFPVLVLRPEPYPLAPIVSQSKVVSAEWQRWFQKVIDLEDALTEPYPLVVLISLDGYASPEWQRWFQKVVDSHTLLTEVYPLAPIVDKYNIVTPEWQRWFQKVFDAE